MTKDIMSPLLYPYDWSTIANRIKQSRNWTCEHCGIRQGESLGNNITVHHKDHNTFSNTDDNLLLLCQICHLAEERKHKRYLKRERILNHFQASGQQIFPGLNPYPTSE